MAAEEDETRKRLEWELSLSSQDIRSNACFHGPIGRPEAEALLRSDGQFLVRLKSGSKQEHVVLSTRQADQWMHFVIQRVLLHEGTDCECLGFALEEEVFDSLADLVTYYVGNGRPISRRSLAVIREPINRLTPLTDIDFYKNKSNKNSLQLKYETPPTTQLRPIRRSVPSVDKSYDNIFIQDKELIQRVLPFPSSSESRIRTKDFFTYLLPKDNRPLEPTAITKIESVLLETGPRILANHLLRTDLDFFGDHLQHVLLPSGQQLRRDLCERDACLSRFVVTSVLTASTARNRMCVLHKWIQVSDEVKSALGDLFGFGSLVSGLSSSWLQEDANTWSLLRSERTRDAIHFETKLRPQLKSIKDCSEPQAPNTCIPFLLSLTRLLDKHALLLEHAFSQHLSLKSWELFDVEKTSLDCGLSQITDLLQMGSTLLAKNNHFHRAAKLVTSGVRYEDLLLDMFRTEFHKHFLFGHKAADIAGEEKFAKLDHVITALANRHRQQC